MGVVMTLEIIGFVMVASHITVIALIILWFGCGKPKSAAQFWAVFKEQFLGIKKHKTVLHSKV